MRVRSPPVESSRSGRPPASVIAPGTACSTIHRSTALPWAPETIEVTELVNLGDFENVLVWAAGIRERTGFSVSVLDGPPRLVIDVAR